MFNLAFQIIKKTRDPRWNEEFQFMVDEAPVDDKIHIEVVSKRRGLRLPFRNKVSQSLLLPADCKTISSDNDIHNQLLKKKQREYNHIQFIVPSKINLSFLRKFQESLGHVDINLVDVVNNGRINEKYHLINSRNGMVHVEMKWSTV